MTQGSPAGRPAGLLLAVESSFGPFQQRNSPPWHTAAGRSIGAASCCIGGRWGSVDGLPGAGKEESEGRSRRKARRKAGEESGELSPTGGQRRGGNSAGRGKQQKDGGMSPKSEKNIFAIPAPQRGASGVRPAKNIQYTAYKMAESTNGASKEHLLFVTVLP